MNAHKHKEATIEVVFLCPSMAAAKINSVPVKHAFERHFSQ